MEEDMERVKMRWGLESTVRNEHHLREGEGLKEGRMNLKKINNEGNEAEKGIKIKGKKIKKTKVREGAERRRKDSERKKRMREQNLRRCYSLAVQRRGMAHLQGYSEHLI